LAHSWPAFLSSPVCPRKVLSCWDPPSVPVGSSGELQEEVAVSCGIRSRKSHTSRPAHCFFGSAPPTARWCTSLGVPPHLLSSCLGSFDQEFRWRMESVTGPTTDSTWALMSLGFEKGGLGLRSAQVHALGGYLASLESAVPLVSSRFPLLSADEIGRRTVFLGELWQETFGPLPEKRSQRELSAAADSVLFSKLAASPDRLPAPWLASISSCSLRAFGGA
jgi:hypothetical protein